MPLSDSFFLLNVVFFMFIILIFKHFFAGIKEKDCHRSVIIFMLVDDVSMLKKNIDTPCKGGTAQIICLVLPPLSRFIIFLGFCPHKDNDKVEPVANVVVFVAVDLFVVAVV